METKPAEVQEMANSKYCELVPTPWMRCAWVHLILENKNNINQRQLIFRDAASDRLDSWLVLHAQIELREDQQLEGFDFDSGAALFDLKLVPHSRPAPLQLLSSLHVHRQLQLCYAGSTLVDCPSSSNCWATWICGLHCSKQ